MSRGALGLLNIIRQDLLMIVHLHPAPHHARDTQVG